MATSSRRAAPPHPIAGMPAQRCRFLIRTESPRKKGAIDPRGTSPARHYTQKGPPRRAAPICGPSGGPIRTWRRPGRRRRHGVDAGGHGPPAARLRDVVTVGHEFARVARERAARDCENGTVIHIEQNRSASGLGYGIVYEEGSTCIYSALWSFLLSFMQRDRCGLSPRQTKGSLVETDAQCGRAAQAARIASTTAPPMVARPLMGFALTDIHFSANTR